MEDGWIGGDAERADAEIAVDLGLAPSVGLVSEATRYETCVGAWALRGSLELMETHLALEIELGLCQGSSTELEALYWYKEYLLSAQLKVALACRQARTALRDERRPVPTYF